MLDLSGIFTPWFQTAEIASMAISELCIGGYYSNGDFGNHWSVRQLLRICDEAGLVRYKVIVGPDRRKEFVCDREAFMAWAKYEVVRNDSTWERKPAPSS